MYLSFKSKGYRKTGSHPTTGLSSYLSGAAWRHSSDGHITQGDAIPTVRISHRTGRTGVPGRLYLEGLELTLHLLGEALAVLAKLALPGGLGNGFLELRFQLQKENMVARQHRAQCTAKPPKRGSSEPNRGRALKFLSSSEFILSEGPRKTLPGWTARGG